jgi:3-oxoadipate enol-lactonase
VRCCRILIGASASGLPAHVQVPCPSIGGSEDQYAPPDLVTEFLRQLPDRGQHVLQDCGHFPFLEQPDAFAAALRPLLERVC